MTNAMPSLLALLSVLAAVSVALAQAPPPDTRLHFKDGQEVRGKLVEVKDGAYVLTLPDGRTVLYPTSDVDVAERITPPSVSGMAGFRALLAPGRRVYVRPVPGRDVHDVVGNLLRRWGRWKIVDRTEDAEIIVRLELSGSAAWGTASIVATIEDAPARAELWKSAKQTGYRTVFHGYASPYNRAAEGILEQMKKASVSWDQR